MNGVYRIPLANWWLCIDINSETPLSNLVIRMLSNKQVIDILIDRVQLDIKAYRMGSFSGEYALTHKCI